jgi:uncharacterized membrane protein YdjX (TVP38/TMEM64 family)
MNMNMATQDKGLEMTPAENKRNSTAEPADHEEIEEAPKLQITDEDENETKGKGKCWQLVVVIVIKVVVAILFFLHLAEAKILYDKIVDWIELNPYLAVVAIIVMYVASIILNVPIVQNQPTLGFTYSKIFKSPWKGFFMTLPICFISCLIGSLCAMLISRYLIKDCVKSWGFQKPWFKKHFKAMDAILKENGIKSMALIRLSVFPFSMSSYAIGVTSIKPMHFFLGSFTFAIRLAMSTFVGCRLYIMGSKEATTEEQVVFGIEIFINVVFTILIAVFAKRTM